MNRKKWLARREMWRQHDSSRLFGAASVVAGNLWAGMPAGLRRLADGCGYGRLVGRCVSLMEGDGQLWNADLLKGLELNENALAPSVRFRGSGDLGFRLEGLAQLNRELDLALGDGAGTVPATFLMAHGLGPFGLGMKGLKLTAEEARVKTAFRKSGARDQGLGARNSASEEEESFGWPIRWRSGQAPGSEGLAADASKPLKRPVQRRFRVWVNAVKVAETIWNGAQKKFHLDASHGVDGVGYVTEWEQNFPDSLDLRNPFEGEKMAFDGEYVVYCALEVSEKRGRHWVRLPYCCRFRLVDVVFVENGELVVENFAAGREEGLCCGKQESISVDADCDGMALIEIKRHWMPCLDILKGEEWLGRDWEVDWMPLLGSGIARSLFSKAFAMAEAIRAGP
jgi:hypothetical protein